MSEAYEEYVSAMDSSGDPLNGPFVRFLSNADFSTFYALE